jgi:hypothetical protein
VGGRARAIGSSARWCWVDSYHIRAGVEQGAGICPRYPPFMRPFRGATRADDRRADDAHR